MIRGGKGRTKKLRRVKMDFKGFRKIRKRT